MRWVLFLVLCVGCAPQPNTYFLYKKGDLVKVRGIETEVVILRVEEMGSTDYDVQYVDKLGKVRYDEIHQNMIEGLFPR